MDVNILLCLSCLQSQLLQRNFDVRRLPITVISSQAIHLPDTSAAFLSEDKPADCFNSRLYKMLRISSTHNYETPLQRTAKNLCISRPDQPLQCYCNRITSEFSDNFIQSICNRTCIQNRDCGVAFANCATCEILLNRREQS